MPFRTNMPVTPTASQLVDRSTEYFDNLSSDEKNLYTKLASEGRHPKAALFACYDSVNPDPFQSKPGEIGWHRNAGNCIKDHALNRHSGNTPAAPYPDGAAATLEMAVADPSLEVVGVIGHQDCAFCKAFLMQQYAADQENLELWVNSHGPATRAMMLAKYGSPPDPKDSDRWNAYLWDAVQQHTIMQYANVLSYPAVVRRVAEGSLTVFAACLQLTPARLVWYDPMIMQFKPASLSTGIIER